MNTILARSLFCSLLALASISCSSPAEPPENEDEVPNGSDDEIDAGVEPEAGPKGCNDPAFSCPPGSYCADDTCRTCWQGLADREAYRVTRHPRAMAGSTSSPVIAATLPST